MGDIQDIDAYLARLQAGIPEGAAWPYRPLNTAKQRWVIQQAIEARNEVKRLERELAEIKAALNA